MKTPYYEALEVCIAALDTGVDIEGCLSLYSDLAAELRPALEAAIAAQGIAAQDVPSEAMNRSRTRMLARANELRLERRGRRRFLGMPRLAFAALAIAVAVLFSGGGLIAGSAQALPGDSLYPAKRAAEVIGKSLAIGAEAKRSLEVTYRQRRIDEVKELLNLGRVERVSFEGIVSSQSPQYLVVEGIQVAVTSQTEILGEIEVGLHIEVEGETQPEGLVIGHKLLNKQLDLIGQVNVIASDAWIISGVEIYILEDTVIDPGIRVGDRVIALIEASGDGMLFAIDIRHLAIAAPTPSPDVYPIPSASPMPTEMDDDGYEIEFMGIVEAIAGDLWVIGDKTVNISAETDIDDEIEIGDIVEVEALVSRDGSILAQEIKLADDGQDDEGDDQDDDGDDQDDDGDDMGDDGDDPDDEDDD